MKPLGCFDCSLLLDEAVNPGASIADQARCFSRQVDQAPANDIGVGKIRLPHLVQAFLSASA